MIQVDKLSKVYGKKQNLFTALNNVSFDIADGSTVAIVGKSGSGKSTLMHIMSGLDHPTSGSVIIDGKNIHTLKDKSRDAFRAKEMSFIFQSFFVEAGQTCYQNVALPLEITKTPFTSRRSKIMKALEQVGLGDKAFTKAQNLSGGQKQRLAVARAIINKPKLIFADEPTGNLDSENGRIIINLLFELNKTLGSNLIIVTHDHELANMCQTQIFMKDGEIMEIKSNQAKNSSTAIPSKNQKRRIVQ
ncbi:ABC transporter ATP-binding protein [Candidatus Saccharibacteria bacterium]|jgi:putative ABC transport system ATP-binding protein|nr:ABC transporter ATP-binding protein [Candidatus Saccharibacteria bacterium]